MWERLKNYIAKVDAIIEDPAEKDMEQVIKEHLVQIQFFQHERLIHLIVTITVAILLMLAFGFFSATGELYIFLIAILLLLLFFPYIIHYYHLENGVQQLYKQYDAMVAYCRNDKKG